MGDDTAPHLPQKTIERTCHDTVKGRDDRLLSCCDGGNAVVALTEDLVVKFGGTFTRDEFENQKQAHQLLAPMKDVKVPQPYNFFNQDGCGFICMERVHGQEITTSGRLAAHKLMDVLRTFATIHGEKPGSLSGGPARGLLWSEYHDFKPNGREELERHFFETLCGSAEVTFSGPLVLCHGDLAARNIMIRGNEVYILDWASAGFHPKLFEIASMRKNTVEPLLADVMRLVTKTACLDEVEFMQACYIEQRAKKNVRYIKYVPHPSQTQDSSLTPGRGLRKSRLV